MNNPDHGPFFTNQPSSSASAGELTVYPDNFRDIDEAVKCCWQMIEGELKRRGFEPLEAQIQMALAEAIINAWKHGHRSSGHLPIVFHWRFNQDFTFEVQDAGPGFNHQDLPDPTQGQQKTAENGRGIFMIKTLAHSLGWRDNGRRLIATFHAP